MKQRVFSWIALITIISALCIAPVRAQEASSLGEATPEATVEAPVVINIEPDAPPATGVDLLAVLFPMILALLAGGSFAFVLHTLGKREKDILERAFLSLPPEAQETIRAGVGLSERALTVLEQITVLLKATVEVSKQITDGLPNREPLPGTLPGGDDAAG
jgi:hypothetical protein